MIDPTALVHKTFRKNLKEPCRLVFWGESSQVFFDFCLIGKPKAINPTKVDINDGELTFTYNDGGTTTYIICGEEWYEVLNPSEQSFK